MNISDKQAPKLSLGPLQILQSDLQQHLLVTGATGSGKTTFLLLLLSQLLATDSRDPVRKPAAVVIDVKGDLLQPIQSMLNACGREGDLLVLGPEPHHSGWNPFADPSLSPEEMARLLINSIQSMSQDPGQVGTSEELFWVAARHELLTALFELAQRTLRDSGGTALRIGQIIRLARRLVPAGSGKSDLMEEAAGLLSEPSAAALLSYQSLPQSTSSCIHHSVIGVLGPFGRDPLKGFIDPEPPRACGDLRAELFAKGKIVVITAGRAEYASDCFPGMVLLKSVLYRLILARARMPEGEKARPIWVVLDEFNRTLNAGQSAGYAAEDLVLEMARSSHTGFLLAAQNLAGLVSAAGESTTHKIAALCRNYAFFENTCPWTARLAQSILGRRLVNRKHLTVTKPVPAPLLFPEDEPSVQHSTSHVLVPELEPVLPVEQLARLSTGEVVLKLANGSVQHVKIEMPAVLHGCGDSTSPPSQKLS